MCSFRDTWDIFKTQSSRQLEPLVMPLLIKLVWTFSFAHRFLTFATATKPTRVLGCQRRCEAQFGSHQPRLSYSIFGQTLFYSAFRSIIAERLIEPRRWQQLRHNGLELSCVATFLRGRYVCDLLISCWIVCCRFVSRHLRLFSNRGRHVNLSDWLARITFIFLLSKW